MKTLKTLVAAAAMLALTGTAQATFSARTGGMVYDDVLKITWLADMNYAKTNMTWGDADYWATHLTYGGYSDWRLPTLNSSDTTCDSGGHLNCTGGELSHLFVTDLGNDDGLTVLNQSNDTIVQQANLALFSNVQSNAYWSGTEYALNLNDAWAFYTFHGSQSYASKGGKLSAVAVRPGDVAAAVPEPQTLALALLALSAVAVARRRRPA